MGNTGDRIIVINAAARLSFGTGCLVIEGDSGKTEIPISAIDILFIQSLQVSITGYLLNELANAGVCVILCDEKFNPNSQIVPMHANGLSSGRLLEQIKWTDENKEKMWRKIVGQKITAQGKLLKELFGDNPLKKYESGDKNFEALAARRYFIELFGKSFNRDSGGDINSALNYGYAILRSLFTRAVVYFGFNDALGIHHCNASNQFNLSCDLMEPFRPFVDFIVWQNRDRAFDKDMKFILMNIPQIMIDYRGKKTELGDGVGLFAGDVLNNVTMPDKLRIRI